MQVTLQRDEVAGELATLEIVGRLPGRRPLWREIEVDVAVQRRRGRDTVRGSARRLRCHRRVGRWLNALLRDAGVEQQRPGPKVLLATHAWIEVDDIPTHRRPRA